MAVVGTIRSTEPDVFSRRQATAKRTEALKDTGGEPENGRDTLRVK